MLIDLFADCRFRLIFSPSQAATQAESFGDSCSDKNPDFINGTESIHSIHTSYSRVATAPAHHGGMVGSVAKKRTVS